MVKKHFDFIDEANMSLLTDFYELTMCASYFQNKRQDSTTFDLFIRKLPPNRSYFIFAGLEQALFFLQYMRFNREQINFLREQELNKGFLQCLEQFRFTGDVWAVQEGSVVFPGEPLIRVTAPIIEAQLVETFILNTVNLQTMIATKASRVIRAAKGRSVIEFGLRRTQGTDAGMKAARCSYVAGAEGTSNVLAGMKYGIPLFGTMAHSYVMFFDKEVEAFRAFADTFPHSSTFLIDTYDNLKGAKNAAIIAKELEKKGYRLNAVRLDSGNLVNVSRKVRELLDSQGLQYVKIFASGDLDVYAIERLLKEGARIDAFGVGTRMSTSLDRPFVDVVYKLSGKVERRAFVPKMKLSKGKVTLPGKKQTFRQTDQDGRYVKDIIGLDDEELESERLLKNVMKQGRITCELPTLQNIREATRNNLSRLPEKYQKLRNAATYPIEPSRKLMSVVAQLEEKLRK